MYLLEKTDTLHRLGSSQTSTNVKQTKEFVETLLDAKTVKDLINAFVPKVFVLKTRSSSVLVSKRLSN